MAETKRLIFKVSNHHVEAAGEPPFVDGDDPNTYTSYFENDNGEQFIFRHDFESGVGHVFCGDAGWENAHKVARSGAEDLMLGPDERAWLITVWVMAKRAQEKRT